MILEGKLAQSDFVELIISAFKESVRTLNLLIAFKLYDKYNLLLELNQIEVTPFLVQQLTENPYFIEHKLKLIEKFLDVMDKSTMLLLLE